MQPARRLALVALTALVLCGVANARPSGDPQYKLVPSDQTWADSIVLNSGDLGAAWHAFGFGETITGQSGETATCSDIDESDLVLTGGTESPTYVRDDGVFMSSTAIIWQSAEQAQMYWDRNIQLRLIECLATKLQAGNTKNAKILVTGVQRLDWSEFASRSAAFRFSLLLKKRVSAKKKVRIVSTRANADFIAIGAGRATAVLSTISVAKRPLADSSKQHVVVMMLRRMNEDSASAPR